MKNRELKQLFYDTCNFFVYVPSIFEDDIWDYLMSTVGDFTGTLPVWEQFCWVAENIYNNDIKKMKYDIETIGDEYGKIYAKALLNKINLFDNNSSVANFNNIEDGRYLTFDLRYAAKQVLFYYDMMTEEEYYNFFKQFENGEKIETCKWIQHRGFAKYVLPIRNSTNINMAKTLIIDTINSGDPVLGTFKNDLNDYFIFGDKLYIKIYEKDIELYKDILYKDYKAINGVSFFVDICEKRTIRKGKFVVYVNNSHKSTKTFNTDNSSRHINKEFYPQIYKKITKQPLHKYDLVYGYDDVYNFFETKIWE